MSQLIPATKKGCSTVIEIQQLVIILFQLKIFSRTLHKNYCALYDMKWHHEKRWTYTIFLTARWYLMFIKFRNIKRLIQRYFDINGPNSSTFRDITKFHKKKCKSVANSMKMFSLVLRLRTKFGMKLSDTQNINIIKCYEPGFRCFCCSLL